MTDSKTPDWAKEEASDLYDLVSDAPSTAKAKAEITLALVEAERRGSANLISIIADIREKSGVGAKPMLGELADAISQALLSAYERGKAEREWQDISTAPKDGREFIAGRFAPDGDKSQPNNLVAVDRWHKMPEDGYTGLGQFNSRHWPATHWMPLPVPPAIRQLLEVKG